jgi:hypothetical protein
MRYGNFRTWLAVAVVGVFLAGCQSSPGRPRYPADPLLVRKTPVVGKDDGPGPRLLASAEPVIPGLPAEMVAALSAPRTPPAEPTHSAPPVWMSREPAAAEGASGRALLEATPAVRQKPAKLK